MLVVVVGSFCLILAKGVFGWLFPFSCILFLVSFPSFCSFGDNSVLLRYCPIQRPFRTFLLFSFDPRSGAFFPSSSSSFFFFFTFSHSLIGNFLSFLFAFSHSVIGNFLSFLFAFSLIGNFPSFLFCFRG